MRYDGQSAADLATRLCLPRVELFAVVDSTQDVAHALAAQGAPSGTLVLADSQTAGRGRLGRPWESGAGRGIWLTLLAREIDRRALDVLSVRIGLCVAAAVDPVSSGPILLKWPNDLYVRDGKVGGILIETRWRDERVDWLAIGVGVNVRPPETLAAAGLGSAASRIELLDRIVPAIRGAVGATGLLDPAELDAFATRDMARGRTAVAPIEGCVQGIAVDGALLVETPSGRQAVRSGSLLFAGDL